MELNKTMIKKMNFQGCFHKFKNRAAFFENKEKIQFCNGDFVALNNRSKLYLVKF